MAHAEIIHCIGDSHVSFFSGYDRVQNGYPDQSVDKYSYLKSYRLGAVLAHSLVKENTKENGREKLFEIVNGLKPASKILLCFGEIDNRCHLVKQAFIQKKSIEDITQECVANYFQVIDELISRGFYCMVFGAVASSESFNEEYPTYGTIIQRNESTFYFNNAIKRECQKRSIFFINLFDYLVNNKRETRTFYFFDGVHLGQIAFPFFLKEVFKHKSIKSLPNKNWLEIQLLIYWSRLQYQIKKVRSKLTATRIFKSIKKNTKMLLIKQTVFFI